MARMTSNIKPSDVYTLAIVATTEKYAMSGTRLGEEELADVLTLLCSERDKALYVEQRDEEEAAKAKMEQEEGEDDGVQDSACAPDQ